MVRNTQLAPLDRVIRPPASVKDQASRTGDIVAIVILHQHHRFPSVRYVGARKNSPVRLLERARRLAAHDLGVTDPTHLDVVLVCPDAAVDALAALAGEVLQASCCVGCLYERGIKDQHQERRCCK